MKKELRIDYHFHPNLAKSDEKALEKCRAIWGRVKEKGIDCVVVTEHGYKNPKRAFELMREAQLEGLYCFPGVECVSKEGIDLVVFSDGREIYEADELKPFKLPYFELIDFVNSHEGLYSYVTHPYTLGLTSVVRKLGMEAYRKSVEVLEAVEVSNGAFDNLKKTMEWGVLKKMFHSKLVDIEKTQKLLKEDYPDKIKFLAAGSDAHHVEDIGNCFVVFAERGWNCESDVFDLVVNNGGRGETCIDDRRFSGKLLLKTALTSFHEFLIKISYGKK